MPLTVLAEALALTAVARQQEYGPPEQMARRFAAIAHNATGLDILPEHLPILMVCVKLARLGNDPLTFNRDTWVDIAGYARVAEMIDDAR